MIATSSFQLCLNPSLTSRFFFGPLFMLTRLFKNNYKTLKLVFSIVQVPSLLVAEKTEILTNPINQKAIQLFFLYYKSYNEISRFGLTPL